MKKLLSLALAFAATALLHGPAAAAAYAEVQITHIKMGIDTGNPDTSVVTFDGDTNLSAESISNSTINQQMGQYIDNPTFAIDANLRYYADYTYTLTVRDDGLTADGPMRDYCVPLHYVSCVFGDGNEVAFAQLFVGFRTSAPRNPFTTLTGSNVSLMTDAGTTADFLTQSGVLEASLFTTNAFYAQNVSFGVYAFTFTNGNLSAVPEPATVSLMFAGLFGLAFMARRRVNQVPQD